nr:Stl1.1 [Starmerella bombicola]
MGRKTKITFDLTPNEIPPVEPTSAHSSECEEEDFEDYFNYRGDNLEKVLSKEWHQALRPLSICSSDSTESDFDECARPIDFLGIPDLRRPHDDFSRMNSAMSARSQANQRLEELTSTQQATPTTVWLIIATAAMTYTLHGFSNSVTNGIITTETFLEQFPEIDTVHTHGAIQDQNSTMQGVTIGVYQLGCALGSFICYWLADKIGRQKVIQLIGVVNCIGIVLQVTAFSLAHLAIGRVVMGIGVGAGHATFPLYLAECVNSRIRGRAIIACAAAGNFGHFAGAAIEIGFYFVHNSAQWRAPIALELIWAIASLMLPLSCPESPRFLLRKGKYEECIDSQSQLTGLPKDDPEVLEEVKALEEALHEAGADELSNGKKPPRRYYRAGLALFIQIMSSMSGIDVVSFFSTQTFESQLNFSPLVSRYLTMGLQACQWLFSTISIFLIDSIGRRPLLLSCAALMTVAMGFLFGLTIPSANENMLKAAILFYFFTMCAYPVGYHLIPSMYTAEVSPGTMRHQICAISGCIHFLFDFAVTLITPVAFESIHSRYYLVYTATNAFTFVVVYLLFLETKGLELETIDEIFEAAPTHLAVVKCAQHIKDDNYEAFEIKN